ncbi:hypothetical protein P152DRAFT_459353 [Eremomyces bilateralis CBS 781.70]|uniref:Uncharacterized protein n=1 Tax=Eremomyces bilateralis CBS 781.70 TaxID=1392243 RepID=A0A6G1G034_9PEZI|nr:uncharacterized protein P152DRAFT_459353 [Eremomyces bilateralis CBS 781.70]KAF1811414.1 hypothetical protein P152DRAFT_459353 [Eremomyces bilateralis CBS 781.70]
MESVTLQYLSRPDAMDHRTATFPSTSQPSTGTSTPTLAASTKSTSSLKSALKTVARKAREHHHSVNEAYMTYYGAGTYSPVESRQGSFAGKGTFKPQA